MLLPHISYLDVCLKVEFSTCSLVFLSYGLAKRDLQSTSRGFSMCLCIVIGYTGYERVSQSLNIYSVCVGF